MCIFDESLILSGSVRRVAVGMTVLVCLALVTAPAGADPIKPVKRPQPTSNDPHPSLCADEYVDRQKHAIDSLTDKEVAALEQQAEKGDMQAIRVLSQRRPKDGAGGIDFAYAAAWKRRAQAAGDVEALFEKAMHARALQAMNDRYPLTAGDAGSLRLTAKLIEIDALDMQDGKLVVPTLEEIVSLAERVVQEHESAGVALHLGIAYGSPHSPPDAFNGIQGDPDKALRYLRFAAERGNLVAAEELCAAYYYGRSSFGIAAPNYVEARRLCAFAAQAECTRSAALYLSELFREGRGGPKNLLDAITWDSIYEHRRAIPDPRY